MLSSEQRDMDLDPRASTLPFKEVRASSNLCVRTFSSSQRLQLRTWGAAWASMYGVVEKNVAVNAVELGTSLTPVHVFIGEFPVKSFRAAVAIKGRQVVAIFLFKVL